MKSVTIPYRQENHGNFDTEWPAQRKVSGWWYVTGYFTNPGEPEKLYSYQFPGIKSRIFGFSPWILQLALTDLQSGMHHFTQGMTLSSPGVYVSRDTVHYQALATLKREQSECC